MRRTLIYATLIATLLLAVSAGTALAQGQAPDRTERQERMAALHAARNESIRSFQENRSALMSEYRESHAAIKASFLENKTAVIDACRAARNETEDDDNSEFAQCVRDGVKPLIESARAAHQADREELRGKLVELRRAAMEQFAKARAEARGRA